MADATVTAAPVERSSLAGKFGRYVLLGGIAFIVLFPIYTAVIAALKPRNRVLINPLVPESFTLEVLGDAWTEGCLGRYLINSVVVAVLVTSGQLVTSMMSGYAFAMLRFPGRNVLFVVFLATMLIPLEATVVVNRQTIDSLGWLNSYQGLVVPFLASAFGTFLLRQALLTLPRDLRDAALIDGVGHLGFLRHIAVPLLRPTLGALGLFTFLTTWNAYLWPNIITTDEDWNTVQAGLRQLKAQALDAPNLVMAGTVIAAVPIAVVLLVFQRQLIRGLYSRSSKGMKRHVHVRATKRQLRSGQRGLRGRGNAGERVKYMIARTLGIGATISLAACASGQSILLAGNDGTTTTAAAVTTGAGAAPAGPPTTICLFPPCSAQATSADSKPEASAASATPAAGPVGGFAAAPGVTMSLAGNPDWPCPVEALDAVTEPVRLQFWHAMQSTQGKALEDLTNLYNASQDRVVVELQNQNGYEELVDKYFQSSTEDRPELVQLPEYMLQQMADDNSVVSASACIQAAGTDMSAFLPWALLAYQTGGVQWAMPLNISVPVLFYNRVMFEEAGLDPHAPPITLEQVRKYSQQIVDSGAAPYGIALDAGVNSGGEWFVEHWLAQAGLPYTDNDNGRTARATRVLFDTPETVEMLTFAQDLVDDGLAVYVGEDPQGIDGLLRMTDEQQPSAMALASSGTLGGALDFVAGGAIPGVTAEEIGVGPMPGPSETPSAVVGGAALYIVRDQGDAEAAAAWDYIQFLTSADSQSYMASESGYAPARSDAVDIDPLATTYADDPRFRVGYDQVNVAAEDFSALGPVLGPMRQVRQVTSSMMADIYNGEDVAGSLTAAAEQADLLITDYNSRN